MKITLPTISGTNWANLSDEGDEEEADLTSTRPPIKNILKTKGKETTIKIFIDNFIRLASHKFYTYILRYHSIGVAWANLEDNGQNTVPMQKEDCTSRTKTTPKPVSTGKYYVHLARK